MPKTTFSDYVKILKPICEGLNQTFVGKIEFILHDLSKPEASVVLVIGDLTHRQIGAPATNLLLQALRVEGDNASDILGYPTLSNDGKVLKSSTIFLRDDNKKIIGCFCFNIDLTSFNALSAILSDFLSTVKSPYQNSANTECGEVFARGIDEVANDIIRYELSNMGMSPTAMSKKDKLRLVYSLDKKGIFGVKGTPEILAEIFGSTVFTIYNYIKEVRNNKPTEQ